MTHLPVVAPIRSPSVHFLVHALEVRNLPLLDHRRVKPRRLLLLVPPILRRDLIPDDRLAELIEFRGRGDLVAVSCHGLPQGDPEVEATHNEPPFIDHGRIVTRQLPRSQQKCFAILCYWTRSEERRSCAIRF